VHENLCLASGAENVASGFELTTELGIIENIACGYDDDLTVFVCQGLPRILQIGDAQPDMREANLSSGVESVTIRSPVPNRRSHAPQCLDGYADRGVPRNTSNAAHLDLLGQSGSPRAFSL
jgi:hypothetical protein